MLYREIVAVCSQIHIKHMNALCVQKVEILGGRIDPTEAASGYCPPLRINIDLLQYLAQRIRGLNRFCPRGGVHEELILVTSHYQSAQPMLTEHSDWQIMSEAI
jgi:hypothetical protein